MTNFEDYRELFVQLLVPHYPRKHWSISFGWDLAISMAVILANHTKKIFYEARFYAISTDKITTVDYESWLSVHIYIAVGFSGVPILLSLSRLTEGNRASAEKECIMKSLSWHTRLVNNTVAERLVCFRADGMSEFQSCRFGIT
jgi:hypothetical protein